MRSALRATLLGCALFVVAACSGHAAEVASKPVSPEPIAPVFAQYVALGDSYTAGPLIAPQAKGSPPICGRSGGNYPSYLASYLGVTTLHDVSCSGAVTADLTSSQSTRMGLQDNASAAIPAQLNALKPSTDLVTLGIGGNDFDLFSGTIAACTLGNPDASTTKRCGARAASGEPDALAKARAVRAHVEKAIAGIRQRSPKAKIVVVGYLRLVPDNRTCATVAIAKGNVSRVNAIEQQLNASLKAAATGSGATFVDAYGLSKGHDICSGANAWVNGSQTLLFRAAAYHPFREGMDAVAGEAYRTLTGKTVPKSPSLEQLAKISR